MQIIPPKLVKPIGGLGPNTINWIDVKVKEKKVIVIEKFCPRVECMMTTVHDNYFDLTMTAVLCYDGDVDGDQCAR